MASWPVFIVGDDPVTLTFTVASDNSVWRQCRQLRLKHLGPASVVATITRPVRQRLHQQAFRERVLEAYREHCSICRLRHQELLEAAHIVADSDPEGEPPVSN